jgi:hypothetical protein
MIDSRIIPSKNICFPTWKELVSNYPLLNQKAINWQEFVKNITGKLDLVQQLFDSKNPIIALSILSKIDADLIRGVEYSEIIPLLEKLEIKENEFFSVYNTAEAKIQHVDKNIARILKITPQEFTIEFFLGLGQNSLIDKNDFPHVIRWAGIAYTVLTLPIFKFRVNKEHYKIKFKLNHSEFSGLTKGNYSLEKKSYLSCSDSNPNLQFPLIHLDNWTLEILPSSAQNVVKPVFVSDAEQTELMNNLAYLFNAALINFPVKYLIMLEERQYFDRNKEVGREMENSIKENANCTAEFSDIQIGDYFKKTIRKKIAETYTTWTGEDKKECSSETEAIQLATQLGLLPIPSNIKKLIYSRVS